MAIPKSHILMSTSGPISILSGFKSRCIFSELFYFYVWHSCSTFLLRASEIAWGLLFMRFLYLSYLSMFLDCNIKEAEIYFSHWIFPHKNPWCSGGLGNSENEESKFPSKIVVYHRLLWLRWDCLWSSSIRDVRLHTYPFRAASCCHKSSFNRAFPNAWLPLDQRLLPW